MRATTIIVHSVLLWELKVLLLRRKSYCSLGLLLPCPYIVYIIVWSSRIELPVINNMTKRHWVSSKNSSWLWRVMIECDRNKIIVSYWKEERTRKKKETGQVRSQSFFLTGRIKRAIYLFPSATAFLIGFPFRDSIRLHHHGIAVGLRTISRGFSICQTDMRFLFSTKVQPLGHFLSWIRDYLDVSLRSYFIHAKDFYDYYYLLYLSTFYTSFIWNPF